jgi:hypothetical protein
MIRLAALLTSAGLLLAGRLRLDEGLLFAGAILFISIQLVDLVEDYRFAKRFRNGNWEPSEEKKWAARVAVWVTGLIQIGALVLVQESRKGAEFLGGAGAIIWVGTIAGYLISGWIAREVGGLPLRMGYGGWRIRHRRDV